MDLSPLYNAPIHPPRQCPRCGRLFEEPFEIEGVRVSGHVQGGPACVPLSGYVEPGSRDARVRKANRRGQ